jgi:ADP-ribose pyrophosphatase YjhB (NUDIX family)
MYCIWCGAPAAGDVVIRCGSCERTHFLNSKISASALVVADGHYLTVKRAAPPELGRWDMPGGFIEYGEEPTAAVVREALEEAGITIKVDRLIGVYTDSYLDLDDGQHWPTINLVYLATPQTLTGDLTAVDPAEVTAIAWHPLHSPPEDLAFPAQQLPAIEAYLDQAVPI